MMWDIFKASSWRPSKLVSSVSLLDKTAKEIHCFSAIYASYNQGVFYVPHTKFNEPIHSQISGANALWGRCKIRSIVVNFD